MIDAALLVLRLTLGSLLAGHGAQKLFGWFGGSGMRGATNMMERMKLRPARPWAITAASCEFGGGVLMLLGFLNPLGPLGALGSMSMAAVKEGWGKPIWASAGGAELPVTNMGIASALMLAGAGKYSLDGALGTKLPRWVILPGLVGVAATLAIGLRRSQRETLPVSPAEAGSGADAVRRWQKEHAGAL
jgi:putative oxidoreductase